MSSCIIAGYTITKTAPLNLSVEEAISDSKKVSSFLLQTLTMMEPHQIKANEIAKDAYEECLQLRDYLSEQLWSVFDDEGISSVQAALDDLSQALSKYEMMYETIEGEWEFVDASCYVSAC
ncbi:hypothetical protein RMATCC62417_13363 [Rhizopus microsporus]|nr:hypothetical protein RMATCC62417_13363 [Rhizopus microsporus]